MVGAQVHALVDNLHVVIGTEDLALAALRSGGGKLDDPAFAGGQTHLLAGLDPGLQKKSEKKESKQRSAAAPQGPLQGRAQESRNSCMRISLHAHHVPDQDSSLA